MVDELERATPQQRRAIADRARARAGLVTFTAIDERKRLAEIVKWPPPPRPQQPMRDWEGKAVQICHAEGCDLVSQERGVISPVAAKRWFCEQHRSQAQPGDLDPAAGPSVRLSAWGGMRESVEAEEFYEKEYAKLRDEDRRRREQAAAEAQEHQRIAARYRATANLPPVAGVPQQRRR